MHLVAFLMTGPTCHNHGMWRHPETQNDFLSAAFWEDLARTLEEAHFDGCFFADSAFVHHETILAKGGQVALLDPFPVATLMARATRKLGIGITISTAYLPPYAIARQLASLDFLSGGRVAWNVVTSAADREAQNFGLDALPPRNERYDRAEEVLEACMQLWGSVEPGALVMDKASGSFADVSKFKSFDFNGKWFSTKGPLIVPQSPQGRPVIMQAGSSGRGRDFAARWAEVIFTVQHSLEDMRAFNADIKARMKHYGRSPEDCKVLAAVDPIIGETEVIARERQLFVNDLVDDDLALATASVNLGQDLSAFDLDEPLPEIANAASQGMLDVMQRGSTAGKLTVRQMAKAFSTSYLCPQVVGTPDSVADQLEGYFHGGGCDGFIIFPSIMPGTFETFARSVVPILQKRGSFRRDYPGATLRDTLRG